ncbi:MAG: BatA domain-containing protein [Flavobacteriales bacterium]|nr:BatA domain-containing protein [Flavobacteriales bacterium]MBK9534870.1 BatA domain-containing protein [Flavobacteriales bacterium]MBP9137656.1 BatA domain-containing protein [Flavobacteriales bacterium]HQX30505.1 BatA domain-containing protein [Flavobacteriales bacterium]HQZ93813.1 BatA domain-containing protein [Flavobacteriales bacterium]
MSFLHPAFLWALAALSIPVLIHLFQLRRFKRIDFPNVRFLAEITQQTRARKKVQHWLVLLARLLALASLVLAFAQPYIPSANTNVVAGQRAVSLYVDDSYSMDGQNAQGRLLDQARKGAQDAVMAYSATDRFQLLTGRFEGKQQVLLGRDEALEAASQVDVSPYARPLSKVMARQREALGQSDAPVTRAFLFTDLQRSVTDIENWTNDTLIHTVIAPLASASPDNLSIDSVWFDSPVRRVGQSEILHVRLQNYGEQELVNVPLRLDINDRQRALASFSILGGATVDTTLRFSSEAGGNHWGFVSIDDRPVTFDDRMYISYRVIDKLRVLLVSGGNAESDKSVADVFSGDSLHIFTQQAMRSLDLSSLARQDLVILNALPEVASGLVQALGTFVENGGSVAVFPPSNGDPSSYAGLFGQFGASPPSRMDTATVKVDRIDLDKPFYRDIFETMQRNVDLPIVRERWSIRPAPGSDVLLRLQDGTAYLSRTQQGRGSIYLCATPLAESSGNFTHHAFFLTSLLRMAELSRPMGALYHTLGEEVLIPLEGIEFKGDAVPHLKGPNNIDLVPEVRRTPGNTAIALHDQDLPPGPYAVVSGNDTLMTLALDLPRRESDLSAYSVDELKALLTEKGLTSYTVLDTGTSDLSLKLNELDQGRKLWKWFILIALLFLAAEVFLIRYLK